MAGLRAHGLDDAIQELVGRGIPLLGICVGMQALFDVSEEMGQHAGLSLMRGQVTRFAESLRVKVPHTGWNQIDVRIEAPLFCGIRPQSYVYFNHSYYCQPADPIHITATASHGLIFAGAVQDKNTFGVQFHPEKSQALGLQILKNFLELR
jgi:glutamine amidotransferase